MSAPLRLLVRRKAKDDDNHLFKQLRERVPPEFNSAKEWMNWLNAGRDWLKHETPQLGDEWTISDISAGTMILRAITKFNWAHKEITQRMINFQNEWLSVLRQ